MDWGSWLVCVEVKLTDVFLLLGVGGFIVLQLAKKVSLQSALLTIFRSYIFALSLLVSTLGALLTKKVPTHLQSALPSIHQQGPMVKIWKTTLCAWLKTKLLRSILHLLLTLMRMDAPSSPARSQMTPMCTIVWVLPMLYQRKASQARLANSNVIFGC